MKKIKYFFEFLIISILFIIYKFLGLTSGHINNDQDDYERKKNYNFDVVVARYETYMKTTKPVLDFYSKNINFTEIDGAAEIEQITNKINEILKV